MSIAQKIRRLPQIVEYQGVVFEFSLIIESPNELKISYDIESADIFSKHYKSIESHGSWNNPFEDDGLQGFLCLREGIKNDDDLEEALDSIYEFLKENNLL